MTGRRNAPRFFCMHSCIQVIDLYLSHLILYTWQVVGVGAGLLELSGRAHPYRPSITLYVCVV